MYIFAIHQVFTKHRLLIRAPTMLNPTNRFGETMFWYTRGLLMEAYIRLRLTQYRDELLGHYILHEKVLRREARMVF